MTKDPRLGFAQWLHNELVSSYATESEPWALDRIHRVQGVINAARPEHPPLEAVILWISAPVAFTTVGRYVYISRALLERLPTDDAAAFVLAHEAAHHDLGHFDLFAGWADWIPESAAYVAVLARLLEHRTYGPEREAAADDHAVRLCIKVGYRGDLVVQALAILENLLLDRGDISGVYGPENLLDPTDPKHGSTAERVQRWLWTHMHGYLPLHERLARGREIVKELGSCDAVATPGAQRLAGN